MSDIAIVILAAGQASRFRAGDASVASKVVATLDGKALVRHVAEAALSSQARPVIVVTGHAKDDVSKALAGLEVAVAHNADFALGMSTSLKAGVAAVPSDAAGAIIMLADMPRIDAHFIGRLIDAFGKSPDADAVVPLYKGQRGNPVLIARRLFGSVAGLTGDEGARRILADPALKIIEISGDESITLDIDTPEALIQASHKG